MTLVVIGLLGTTLDRGVRAARWERWRPTIALCAQDDLVVDRFELLCPPGHTKLRSRVVQDLAAVSPETEVTTHELDVTDPWDFGSVFAALFDFCRAYAFDPENEQYLVHVTTGTHVAQICLFLLTESRHIPGRLIQTGPDRHDRSGPGSYRIVDLDLSKYDAIATRFAREHDDSVSFLKSGIATRNSGFNALIERIEKVAVVSDAPILLTGPTGAGKSQLARRVYELKRAKNRVSGPFVPVNCATLRGDQAMSALFGHVRGAFTGAERDRPGLLKSADGGVLFLDEIGELGLDEQAMLLRAIEQGVFLPVGTDVETSSRFQLIAGTNRDLFSAVSQGKFREDLLARIDLWTFRLPGLSDRPEDIAPNLDYELEKWADDKNERVSFNRQARDKFEAFATSPDALWSANFRDFNAALTRMATLAPKGRIDEETVDEEIERLTAAWKRQGHADDLLTGILGADRVATLDRFERVQLNDVVKVCRRSATISAAGRTLFSESRKKKAKPNDADRLRKYLAKYGLTWSELNTVEGATHR